MLRTKHQVLVREDENDGMGSMSGATHWILLKLVSANF